MSETRRWHGIQRKERRKAPYILCLRRVLTLDPVLKARVSDTTRRSSKGSHLSGMTVLMAGMLMAGMTKKSVYWIDLMGQQTWINLTGASWQRD